MALTREVILQKTDNGLHVFRHFIKKNWKEGKTFLNPFYPDTKPSCNIYRDRKTGVYKIKDFGMPEFSGDCFFLVGKICGLDCSTREGFQKILQTIDSELSLSLTAPETPQHAPKPPYPPKKPTAESKKEDEQPKEALSFEPPTLKEFTPEEMAYWNQYGITTQVLRSFGVVSVNRFEASGKTGNRYSIVSTPEEPMFAYPGKQFVKIYRPKSRLRFLYAGNLGDGYIFGLEQLPLRGDVLFITGGEKDVMSLAAQGLHAICFNSETADIPHKVIRRLSFRFKHITLLYDCDETGIAATGRHKQKLKEFDLKALMLPLAGTKSEKDVSDYFRMGNTGHQLMLLFSQMLDKLYEETMAVLKSCEIDFDNPPVRPEPIITIQEVTIGSPGNIVCITGSEGSGKTNYLGGIISGAIGPPNTYIDTLGTEIKRNPKEKAVLIYDTEQSEDQLFKNLTFIMKRSSLISPPPYFKAYCMAGLSRKDRMHSIYTSMDKFYYQFGGIHMIVIDGIADLIDGVNDEEKSVQLVEELFRLAGIYKTCVVVVLHMAPSGLKLRGHLGSEIQRKAAGILSVEKEPDTGISIIKAIKVRDGSPLDVPLLKIGWDKELNHHVFLGEKTEDEVESRKVEDLSSVARDIFARKHSFTYSQLVEAIMESLYVKERMAKNYLKFMREAEIIAKTPGNSGEFILRIAPF